MLAGVADDPFFQQEADPFADPFFQVMGAPASGPACLSCSVLRCVEGVGAARAYSYAGLGPGSWCGLLCYALLC